MEITKTETEGKIKGKFLNKTSVGEMYSNMLLSLLEAFVMVPNRILDAAGQCEQHEVRL